jgi:hypothetical protein
LNSWAIDNGKLFLIKVELQRRRQSCNYFYRCILRASFGHPSWTSAYINIYIYIYIYCNGFDQRVARQQLCKHGPTRNNGEPVFSMRWRHAIMEEAVFSMWWLHQQYRLCFPWCPCSVYIAPVCL